MGKPPHKPPAAPTRLCSPPAHPERTETVDKWGQLGPVTRADCERGRGLESSCPGGCLGQCCPIQWALPCVAVGHLECGLC